MPRRPRSSVKSVAKKSAAEPPAIKKRSLLGLRPYQWHVYNDNTTGILILHWSRQIGKSYTLAAWAVDRMLTRPGRLITVLSNSKDNGSEFAAKCALVCKKFGVAATTIKSKDYANYDDMRFEIRAEVVHKTSRIKILAANPRTARGFSGDLILDEFAFHEDSAAIWEAAEPILSSNPDFLCRIASTGNGKHNLFYRMASGIRNSEFGVRNSDSALRTPHSAFRTCSAGFTVSSVTRTQDCPAAGVQASACPDSVNAELQPGLAGSAAGFTVSRVTRTMAHGLGVPIFDPATREPVSPAEARARALDKAAYDQNYECAFADENMTLLTHELISAAERDDVGFICEQDWSRECLAALRGESVAAVCDRRDDQRNSTALIERRYSGGALFVGVDVGRHRDLTVITVIERSGGVHFVRGILRLQGMRLPEQQRRLGEICRLPKFRRACIDMTGIGLGLTEYSQDEFGRGRIRGINFAATVPLTDGIAREGRKHETVRVTEAMATELLALYEDRRIQHPRDGQLRDDLRKPEKITSPGGRVSIAATRTEAGHADHFWSLALAVEAASAAGGVFQYRAVGSARPVGVSG